MRVRKHNLELAERLKKEQAIRDVTQVKPYVEQESLIEVTYEIEDEPRISNDLTRTTK